MFTHYIIDAHIHCVFFLLNLFISESIFSCVYASTHVHTKHNQIRIKIMKPKDYENNKNKNKPDTTNKAGTKTQHKTNTHKTKKTSITRDRWGQLINVFRAINSNKSEGTGAFEMRKFGGCLIKCAMYFYFPCLIDSGSHLT